MQWGFELSGVEKSMSGNKEKQCLPYFYLKSINFYQILL